MGPWAAKTFHEQFSVKNDTVSIPCGVCKYDAISQQSTIVKIAPEKMALNPSQGIMRARNGSMEAILSTTTESETERSPRTTGQ